MVFDISISVRLTGISSECQHGLSVNFTKYILKHEAVVTITGGVDGKVFHNVGPYNHTTRERGGDRIGRTKFNTCTRRQIDENKWSTTVQCSTIRATVEEIQNVHVHAFFTSTLQINHRGSIGT
jgi:hypothetical protein